MPEIDPKEYQLEIVDIRGRTVTISLDDLRTKYPITTIGAALQCAGNRRSEMNTVREVRGLAWTRAAISNAEWKGVKLTDLLGAHQINVGDGRIAHVQFEGADLDPASAPYGASLPAEKACKPNSN